MGQKGEIEHAIHSLRAAFKNILLMDAKNVFNGLNSVLAFLFLTPYITHIANHQICLLTNKLYSLKNIQPKATPLRCRCMELPLSHELCFLKIASKFKSGMRTMAKGSLENLKKLFDSLKKHGPAFGYHLTKCHIITKEHLFERSQ